MKIDGKFDGVIYRRRDMKIEEEVVCFVPRDDNLLPLLSYYRQLCVETKCGQEQIDAVGRLFKRVQAWRDANPEQCKLPDAMAGECP